MSDTVETLRRQIDGATDLASVVRTMKAVAASSIGQYESAVDALSDYYRTVELGLSVCFRQSDPPAVQTASADAGAVVFGSDQGLIGQFNDVLADFVLTSLNALPGVKTIWAVGERIDASLAGVGLPPVQTFTLPNSIAAVSPVVGEILVESEKHLESGKIGQLIVFHNRPKTGEIYEPVSRRILPLDRTQQQEMSALKWPTANLPEVIGPIRPALIREYLFITLFQACAESLASENATRLAAMQRAEKNIAGLLEDLNRSFHRLRQSSIDEELFDVISGFEALGGSHHRSI